MFDNKTAGGGDAPAPGFLVNRKVSPICSQICSESAALAEVWYDLVVEGVSGGPANQLLLARFGAT